MNFADITFNNPTQIYKHISEKGRENKALAAVFIPGSTIPAGNCALCRNNCWDMWVDHLPLTGYAHSAITEDYMKKVFIFKHQCLEYARAYFMNEDKPIIYVDLVLQQAEYCKIIGVKDYGFRREFEILIQDKSETITRVGSGYGRQWVFLDPET